MTGFLVAFEGTDGTGKDQQAELLIAHLRARGLSVLAAREPDEANPVGRLLRQLLASGDMPQAHLPLFVADRLASQPARVAHLRTGGSVVQVRSFLSTLVYQRDHYPLKTLIKAHEAVTLFPHLVLILEISPDEAARRLAGRGRTAECYEGLERQQIYAERYRQMAGLRRAVLPVGYQEPFDAVCIDGTGSLEAVHARVVAAVQPWLG